MKNKNKNILDIGLGSNAALLLFVAPALLLVLNASIIPLFMNFLYSFTKWNGVSKEIKFVFLSNYVKIFTRDKDFWIHLVFTLKYLAVFTVLVNALAIAIAMPLAKSSTYSSVIRAAVFLPYVISLIAVGLIWKFIFGIGFESIAEITGIELFARGWMSEVDLVFTTIQITTLWQNIGFFMIIYIAGLVSIPKSILEASSIDGASGITQFFRIKLPLLAPSITVCLFYSITYALKLFEILLVLTGGGPGGYSMTIIYDIYNEAFVKNRYGLGTAKSVVFLIIVLIITITQLRVSKRMEVEA